MIAEDTEFLCERRLKTLDERLHTCYRNSVFAMDRLLMNYKSVFPFYTDHTFEHSAQVIRYCNILAGAENINRLNADELYVLLMGASLHDVGMGISGRDFDELKYRVPGFREYERQYPSLSVSEYAREFHQELSAEFIKKYDSLFEIPSEQHRYCICQIVRGHRGMDFADPDEFPAYRLENGNTVRLAYLAALVKLADELDITADRNLMFDYSAVDTRWSKKQTMCYLCHKAIRGLAVGENAIVLHFRAADDEVRQEIAKTYGKVQRTFDEFAQTVARQSVLTLRQHTVRFEEDE